MKDLIIIFVTIILLVIILSMLTWLIWPTQQPAPIAGNKPPLNIPIHTQMPIASDRIEDPNEGGVPDHLDISTLEMACFTDGTVQIRIEYFADINLEQTDQYFDLYFDMGEFSSADAWLEGSLIQYRFEYTYSRRQQPSYWIRPFIHNNQLIMEIPWTEWVGEDESVRLWLVGGKLPRRTFGLDMLNEEFIFYPNNCDIVVSK